MEISLEERASLQTPNFEVVRDFCAKALLGRLKGGGHEDHYGQMVGQLSVLAGPVNEEDDMDTLLEVLCALPSCISTISKSPSKFADLLNSIFAYKWALDVRISVAVMAFIGQLVSMDATFCLPIFEKIVPNFLHQTTPMHAMMHLSQDQRSSFIHRTLRGIITLSPASVHQLQAIINRFFPHKRFAIEVQTQFVREILKICQYCPNLQGSTLDLIICKCVEIDVEIAVEEGGDVRIEAIKDDDADLDGAIFDFETEDGMMVGLGGGSGSSSSNANIFASNKKSLHSNSNSNMLTNSNSNSMSQQRIPDEILEMSEKLDAMTSLVVDYVEALLSQENRRLSDQLASQLFQIFEERIITTHKSKFVQFIIFFICSRHPDAATHFGNRLFQLFFDESVSMIKRQSAVMYLASYLSRATFLSTGYVSEQLTDLITWCGSYVELADLTASRFASSTSNSTVLRSLSGGTAGAGTGQQQQQQQQGATFGLGLQRRTVSMPELGSLNYNSNSSSNNFRSAGNVGFTKRLEDSDKNTSHELFYCAFEAACYTLCFLGASMAAEHRDIELVRADWNRTASHVSEPLRFCLQSVRIEFLKLALHVGLLTDEFWSGLPGDILSDDPHRMSSSRSHGDSSLSCGLNPLDSFFPFDPCLLRMLKTRVETGFRVWAGSISLSDSNQFSSSSLTTAAVTADSDLLNEGDDAGGMPSSVSSSVSSQANPNYLASSASSGGMSGGVSLQQMSSIFNNQTTLNQLRRSNRGLSIGSDYAYSDLDGSAPSSQPTGQNTGLSVFGGGGGGGGGYNPLHVPLSGSIGVMGMIMNNSNNSNNNSNNYSNNYSGSNGSSTMVQMHALTGSNLSAFLGNTFGNNSNNNSNNIGDVIGTSSGSGGRYRGNDDDGAAAVVQDGDGGDGGHHRRPRQYSISSTGSW